MNREMHFECRGLEMRLELLTNGVWGFGRLKT